MKALAVIDVETTGLNPYRHDRIVEVAAVILIPGQGISAEFNTLINPERDIGPTRIHGITASDVVNAPRFADIAAYLAEFLSGVSLLAGHNVRFDTSFLQLEYRRAGIEMPRYLTIDTMNLAGKRTLTACCSAHGIVYDGFAHAALHDARATACLLEKLLPGRPDVLAYHAEAPLPKWPSFQSVSVDLCPRGSLTTNCVRVPSFIQRLTESMPNRPAQTTTFEGERDYQTLLWRVLEDGRIDESEGAALVEIATKWGLDISRIQDIHRSYLCEIARITGTGRTTSEAEKREIDSVAQLLGFGRLPDEKFEDIIHPCQPSITSLSMSVPAEDLTGKTICLTGESSCILNGQCISRELAELLATERGLKVASTVTKALDLLVLADPNSQSGKAKKARQYGIRIIHEPVFWRMLGIVVD